MIDGRRVECDCRQDALATSEAPDAPLPRTKRDPGSTEASGDSGAATQSDVSGRVDDPTQEDVVGAPDEGEEEGDGEEEYDEEEEYEEEDEEADYEEGEEEDTAAHEESEKPKDKPPQETVVPTKGAFFLHDDRCDEARGKGRCPLPPADTHRDGQIPKPERR